MSSARPHASRPVAYTLCVRLQGCVTTLSPGSCGAGGELSHVHLQQFVSVRGPLEREDEDAAVPRHVPTVRYADVAGQAAAVQAVRDVCELPLTHGAYFAALGLAPPRGVILYGPPGNGKTLRPQATLTADLWSIFAPPFSCGVVYGPKSDPSKLNAMKVEH